MLSHRKRERAKFEKISWVLNNRKLDGPARWQIFKSLFRSKVSYAANPITAIDKESWSWLKSFYYRSLKLILDIIDNANKDRLIELCLGSSFRDFQHKETMNTIS